MLEAIVNSIVDGSNHAEIGSIVFVLSLVGCCRLKTAYRLSIALEVTELFKI
jgi:hypothetical protein